MAKVYIAARWVEREKMPEIAEELEVRGHSITHEWWKFEALESNPEKMKEFGQQDVMGVFKSDLVLLINSGKSEGKAVEQGLAIALGRPIVAVGKRGEHSQNVFHYLEDYRWVENLEQAYETIERIGRIIAPTTRSFRRGY